MPTASCWLLPCRWPRAPRVRSGWWSPSSMRRAPSQRHVASLLGCSNPGNGGLNKPEFWHRGADDFRYVRRDEMGIVPPRHARIGAAEIRRITSNGAAALDDADAWHRDPRDSVADIRHVWRYAESCV